MAANNEVKKAGKHALLSNNDIKVGGRGGGTPVR
jgi:hypothetical protein